MTSGIYTPGEVSGLTGIPRRSIRRIVNRFPELFSPWAIGEKGKRGNRFTRMDVIQLVQAKGHARESNWAYHQIKKMQARPKPGVDIGWEINGFLQETRILRNEFVEVSHKCRILYGDRQDNYDLERKLGILKEEFEEYKASVDQALKQLADNYLNLSVLQNKRKWFN